MHNFPALAVGHRDLDPLARKGGGPIHYAAGVDGHGRHVRFVGGDAGGRRRHDDAGARADSVRQAAETERDRAAIIWCWPG